MEGGELVRSYLLNLPPASAVLLGQLFCYFWPFLFIISCMGTRKVLDSNFDISNFDISKK